MPLGTFEKRPMLYHLLPLYNCGTIGFDYRSEYIIDAIIKNSSEKSYRLILIFFGDETRNMFRRQLYIRLRNSLLYRDLEMVRNRSNHIRFDNSEIYMFNGSDKRFIERRMQGIGRGFVIVEVDYLINDEAKYIINVFRKYFK